MDGRIVPVMNEWHGEHGEKGPIMMVIYSPQDGDLQSGGMVKKDRLSRCCFEEGLKKV